MAPGTCYDANIFTAVVFVNAVVGTTADYIYALIPVWMIWGIQMDRNSKVAVSFVLGLGVL